ncbi:helix-hairpin-helix domain-containing protein [Actinomyces gerencseriae]|uniref:helix-hairpin-helix domain-containing protein n=1 Tax=Actinomyces gerencseriae TaxID=52769 RepID=UPI0023F12CBB|nr:helix-hairpin-helix domain-containing protein [Actinomyces gerencseriae]
MALDRIDVLVSQKSVAWRFLNSLWIVFIIIGLGIFSIFGWLWAGILARSPKIWRIVAAWGIIVALLFISATLSENNKNFFWNALTTVLLMISWIGSLVHAFIVRGIVLREAVAREDELSRLRAYEQYYGSPQIPNHVTTNASRTMPVPASGSPLQAQGLQGLPSQSPLPPELRVDMAQYYEQPTHGRPAPPDSPMKPASQAAHIEPQPFPVPPTPLASSAPPISPASAPSLPTTPALARVDVNTASSEDLLSLPTLDPAAVARIITARGERGGFRDINDLALAAALQPHQLVALQDRVSFSQFEHPGGPTHRAHTHGRILDL